MADVVNISTPPIGGWCNMGCVFVDLVKIEGAQLTSDSGDALADSAPEKYTGTIVLLQGGNPSYGTRNVVKIFVKADESILVERKVDSTITQRANMTRKPNEDLGGTTYKSFSGTTAGPGTNEEPSVLRFV